MIKRTLALTGALAFFFCATMAWAAQTDDTTVAYYRVLTRSAGAEQAEESYVLYAPGCDEGLDKVLDGALREARERYGDAAELFAMSAEDAADVPDSTKEKIANMTGEPEPGESAAAFYLVRTGPADIARAKGSYLIYAPGCDRGLNNALNDMCDTPPEKRSQRVVIGIAAEKVDAGCLPDAMKRSAAGLARLASKLDLS